MIPVQEKYLMQPLKLANFRLWRPCLFTNLAFTRHELYLNCLWNRLRRASCGMTVEFGLADGTYVLFAAHCGVRDRLCKPTSQES